jgi:hypothetical protein
LFYNPLTIKKDSAMCDVTLSSYCLLLFLILLCAILTFSATSAIAFAFVLVLFVRVKHYECYSEQYDCKDNDLLHFDLF